MLGHLAHVGFRCAPLFLGVDDAGREMLSYVPGAVPADLGHYEDGQLFSASALLRRFHDATTTMPLVMASGFAIACHNDWAPTNAVFQDDMPIGMIDFDTARPGERLWDLGYSAWTWLDLGNDDYASAEQVRRLGAFAAGYAHDDVTPARIAVHAVARQTALAASAAARGRDGIAAWASRCAGWTARYLLDPLMPTGYSRYA